MISAQHAMYAVLVVMIGMVAISFLRMQRDPTNKADLLQLITKPDGTLERGAFDCKFLHCTPQEAFAFILANPQIFLHLTTLENVDATPTWLHADCRNHGKSGIWVVNP